MSDDAPAPAGGAPAAGGGGGHGGGGTHAIDQTNGTHEKMESKPKITKATFDSHVSDLNSAPRRISADSLDLDDYFVCSFFDCDLSKADRMFIGRPS